ncbi:hypothetical protein EJ110_NYTH03920 [Nymphaea thermarum]|nr:hypothetical protein EJ110_NYTH03920 [Nymphaea thermarum]
MAKGRLLVQDVVAALRQQKAGTDRICTAHMPVQVRPVFSLHGCPCSDPARLEQADGVLPGGLEVPMWEQAVHALANTLQRCSPLHSRK